MKTSNIKILGQEPAAAVGVLEGFLVLLLSFGVHGLSQDRVADIVAVVTAIFGLIAAYTTKDTFLAALVGFTKSALILAAAYGLKLTDAQTGSLIAFIAIAGGYYLRSKTSSLATPISNPSPGDVTVVASVDQAMSKAH